MLRAFAVGMLLLPLALLPATGKATTLNELKVGLRVVDFMVSPPKGPTALAVIYDSQVKASLEDAQSLFAWLKESSGTAKAELIPSLVDIRQLSDTPSFRIGFIAAGMESHYGRILDFARRNRTLTISADLSCVRSGKCTVGVAGAPRV